MSGIANETTVVNSWIVTELDQLCKQDKRNDYINIESQRYRLATQIEPITIRQHFKSRKKHKRDVSLMVQRKKNHTSAQEIVSHRNILISTIFVRAIVLHRNILISTIFVRAIIKYFVQYLFFRVNFTRKSSLEKNC